MEFCWFFCTCRGGGWEGGTRVRFARESVYRAPLDQYSRPSVLLPWFPRQLTADVPMPRQLTTDPSMSVLNVNWQQKTIKTAKKERIKRNNTFFLTSKVCWYLLRLLHQWFWSKIWWKNIGFWDPINTSSFSFWLILKILIILITNILRIIFFFLFNFSWFFTYLTQQLLPHHWHTAIKSFQILIRFNIKISCYLILMIIYESNGILIIFERPKTITQLPTWTDIKHLILTFHTNLSHQFVQIYEVCLIYAYLTTKFIYFTLLISYHRVWSTLCGET